MNRFFCIATLTLALLLVFAPAQKVVAQDSPYTEGVVINVSEIRTNPGQFNAYMNYICGDYARLMEAYKADGILVDWGVFVTQPGTAEGADVILTTVYPNMAAFDNLDERTRPIVQRVLNWTSDEADAQFGQRERMRTTLGSRLIRRLDPRP